MSLNTVLMRFEVKHLSLTMQLIFSLHMHQWNWSLDETEFSKTFSSIPYIHTSRRVSSPSNLSPTTLKFIQTWLSLQGRLFPKKYHPGQWLKRSVSIKDWKLICKMELAGLKGILPRKIEHFLKSSIHEKLGISKIN